MAEVSKVSQLSEEKLKQLATDNGVEVPEEGGKDALAEALAPQLTDQEVETYLGEQDSEDDESDEDEESDEEEEKGE